MPEWAYFPIIGRGEQVRLLAAENDITLTDLNVKHPDAPMGTFPVLKDGDVTLNDSAAIMFYLAKKYPGAATPQGVDLEAKCLDMWSVQQDYYSFVLSPMHDLINGQRNALARNLRLSDVSDEQDRLKNLVALHKKRCGFLEKRLAAMPAKDYSCGDTFTLADIFLYTNVRTTQHCKKFEGFRAALGGNPFADYPTISAIADKVGAREKISPTAGKFADMPM